MDNKTSIGMDIFDWLSILFIALKLTGYINWSWVWVLSPIWIQLILIIILVIWRVM
jgi:hypothetical protein